jgi:hypothetical protein
MNSPEISGTVPTTTPKFTDLKLRFMGVHWNNKRIGNPKKMSIKVKNAFNKVSRGKCNPPVTSEEHRVNKDYKPSIRGQVARSIPKNGGFNVLVCGPASSAYASRSTAVLKSINNVSTAIHEIGHLMGLGHAMKCRYSKNGQISSISQYGDNYKSCMSATPFNGVYGMAHLHKLGWVNDGEVIYISFPDGSNSVTHTLSEMQILDSDLPRCLVWKLDNNVNLYYSYVKGVIVIHSYFGLESKTWLPTINIKEFDDGYVDHVSGLTFLVKSSSEDKVELNVTYKPEDVTPPPEVTLDLDQNKYGILLKCTINVTGLYPLGDKKFTIQIGKDNYVSKKVPMVIDKTVTVLAKIPKKHLGQEATVSLGSIKKTIQLIIN